MPVPILTSRPGPVEPNQTPPYCDIDLYGGNAVLREAVARFGAHVALSELQALGKQYGSAEFLELSRLANDRPPRLVTHDPRGARADYIEFHPAWHALMRAGMAAGLHNLTWTGGSHVDRSARLFMAYQAEAGHVCPLTMTHAAMAALRARSDLSEPWRERIAGTDYDPALKPWWEKSSVTIGMGMTERQGGTDVRANTSTARPVGDHYEITGHKWFMSAPMCDGFLVLAQAPGGLTCFLLPRFRPDGSLNALHFQRLKDKLGNRSNASSEVEFAGAYGECIGEEGRGVRTIIEMVQLTRLDCVVASAGLMRFGLASAVHHARCRSVFQKRLIDQPLMRAVLSDMALEVEAVTALAMRLAAAFEVAANDPVEVALARLLTPATKYYVCKIAPNFLYEAMECHGGNGYVEELPLARAYREAPVNAIWEGSGNVMALDVLRAVNADAGAAIETLRTIAATGPQLLCRVADETLSLMCGPQAEAYARLIAEQIAKIAAAAALHSIQPGFAERFASTRLAGEPRATLGADPPLEQSDRLLSRF